MNSDIERLYNDSKYIIEKKFYMYEREKVLDAYKEHLYRRYGTCKNINKGYNKVLQLEIKFFGDKDKNYIKSYLIKDEYLETLSYLSSLAEQYALNRINNDVIIDSNIYNNLIENMNKCLNNVKSYNRFSAKKLYSEAFVDLEFALGLSNKTSLRIGRMR